MSPVITWLSKNIFALIGGLILVLFIGAWLAVLIPLWQWTAPDPAAVPPVPATPVVISSGLVLVAGLLATTLGTQTASSLGFAVAEVKNNVTKTGKEFTASAVATALNPITWVAVIVYLVVGAIVFFTWLAKEQASPELVVAFALSLLGWLIGASGVIFKPLAD